MNMHKEKNKKQNSPFKEIPFYHCLS